MSKDIISFKKYLLSLVFKSKKVGVLMYHSISNDGRFLSVSPQNFEKQLAFLKKKNFNVVSLGKLEEFLKEQTGFTYKTIILTFDDGYSDNFSVVFPLIKQHNFPIIIFLVIDLVGKKGYLSWSEIKEMQASGLVEFGCHTMSHPDLTKISGEELAREIKESKQILENELKINCNYFSYPKGIFNEQVTNKVKDSGYRLAFTVKEECVNSKGQIFELPRLSIDKSTTWCQFLGKISGLQFIKGKI